MKLSNCLAAIVAASAVTSCASFNGGYSADLDDDGVVSAKELRMHQNRVKAGESEQNCELHRFEHIDKMISVGERIASRIRRL